MKLKVFYSWQSDILFNNQAIRDALKLAIIDLEKNPDNPRIDSIDSTSNQVGASRIPDLILKDISTSDVFLCDLTIVGKSDTSGRKIPNPNVLIELGYALSELNWHRTIVVFNEYFGDLAKDLPFDIEKRSVLTIRIENKDDNNGKGLLKSKLKDWVQKIITQKPTKPLRSGGQSDFVKRTNDIKYLKQFLKLFEIRDMDHFFQHGHVEIERSLIRKWEELNDFIMSKEFYVYDEVAKGLLLRFLSTQNLINDLLKDYKVGTVYLKHKDINGFGEKRFERSKALIKQIETAYIEILDHIRSNYLDIKVRKRRY